MTLTTVCVNNYTEKLNISKYNEIYKKQFIWN